MSWKQPVPTDILYLDQFDFLDRSIWFHILLTCNRERGLLPPFFHGDRRFSVILSRGQTLMNIGFLATCLNISRYRVRQSIEKISNFYQKLQIKQHPAGLIITVVAYDEVVQIVNTTQNQLKPNSNLTQNQLKPNSTPYKEETVENIETVKSVESVENVSGIPKNELPDKPRTPRYPMAGNRSVFTPYSQIKLALERDGKENRSFVERVVYAWNEQTSLEKAKGMETITEELIEHVREKYGEEAIIAAISTYNLVLNSPLYYYSVRHSFRDFFTPDETGQLQVFLRFFEKEPASFRKFSSDK